MAHICPQVSLSWLGLLSAELRITLYVACVEEVGIIICRDSGLGL